MRGPQRLRGADLARLERSKLYGALKPRGGRSERVETDSGLVGLGRSLQPVRSRSPISAQAEELGRYLIGRDPFCIRHFLPIAFDDYAEAESPFGKVMVAGASG